MPTATPWPLVLIALALAGCDRPGPAPAEPEAPQRAAALEPQLPARRPPPAYVGRWAAEPGLCKDGAWRFEAGEVSTAGEVSCAFTKVEPTAAGYRIEASCLAEGSKAATEIRLDMTDPAPPQAMTVSGGPWSGPITLRRCPEG